MLTAPDVLHRYLVSSGADPGATSQLLSWLKAQVADGHAERVAKLIPRVVVPDIDYTTAVSLHRLLKRVRSLRPPGEYQARIAVLGSMTTHQLVDLLDLNLQAGRIYAQFYEADFGTLHQEFLDSSSGLHQFRPNFILLVTSWRDLKARP